MFRARFADAFPRSLPHFGPQDIERGVVDSLPDDNVEKLLCALIGLVLNRKKDVECVFRNFKSCMASCERRADETRLNSEKDTTHVLSKKPSNRTRDNGHAPGKARTLSTEVGASTIWTPSRG